MIGRADAAAAILGLAGAFGLGAAVLLASAGTGRARYRPRPMTPADWALALVTLLAPVAMAVCSVAGDASLVWFASPLRWPTFHPLPAAALVPLLVPVLLHPRANGGGWVS